MTDLRFVTYGALDVAVTSEWDWLYDDQGSHDGNDLMVYTPKAPSGSKGWKVLAHVAQGNYSNPDGRTAVLVRGVNPTDEMIKPPRDLTKIWTTSGSTGRSHCAVWEMVPEEGYVALGDIVTGGWEKPTDLSAYACVRKTPLGGHSYVREASVGDWIWQERHMKTAECSFWGIKKPSYPEDKVERLLLGLNAFVAAPSYDKPTNRTVYVLDLPSHVIIGTAPPVPVLTSNAAPYPQETAGATDRTVVLPCTLVKDPAHDMAWQAVHSPFYKFERHVSYYWQQHLDNSQGASEQNPKQRVTTGVSKESSEEFTKRTSVTVTHGAGIMVQGISASQETSISMELGYSRRTGVTQFEEREEEWTMNTPARLTAVMWSLRHEIIAKRWDGDVVGGVGGLAFDLDSRVYTQFPAPVPAEAHTDGTGSYGQPVEIP